MNEAKAIHKIFGKKPAQISCEPLDGIGLTNRIASGTAGVARYNVGFTEGTEKSFIGKRKSVKIIINGINMAGGNSIELKILLLFNHKIFGYNRSAIREAFLYKNINERFASYLPETFGSYTDTTGSNCFIAMNEIEGRSVKASDINRLIDVISDFHAQYFGDESAVGRLSLNYYNAADYKWTRGCLRRMFLSLSEENIRLFGQDKTDLLLSFIDNIHSRFSLVESRRTLTHNDYSERNIMINGERVIVYDWELACYQNPEHDLIEIIVSVMADMSDEEVKSALRYYKERISSLTGVTLTDEEHKCILEFNTYEYCVNKLSVLRLASKKLGMDYTDKFVKNAARLIEILGQEI